MEKSDEFWGQDFKILYDTKRLYEFFPHNKQSLAEKVNAISRLVIYTSIVISFYQGTNYGIQVGVFLLIVLYIMWNNKTIKSDRGGVGGVSEGFKSAEPDCTRPTPANPYMNLLYGDPIDKPPACIEPGVQELASNLLNEQLYMDTDDLFDKRANQRLFITLPNGNGKNPGVEGREKYANWLIGGISDCKTDGICPPYEDLRLNRRKEPELLPGFNF